MKKKFSRVAMLFIALLCVGNPLSAQDYTAHEVQNMAVRYFTTQDGIMTANADEVSFTIDSLYLEDNPKMFLCQDGTNWVILANEQSVPPIVCHGEGQISVSELQESPLWMLLDASMVGLDSLRITGDTYIGDESIEAYALTQRSKPKGLLDLKGDNLWAQSSNNNGTKNINWSYNKFCPTFFDSSNGRTYVGCTAVAMAQIMWYHQWPQTAKVPANINKAGIVWGEITRTYNWSLMPSAIYNTTPMEQINAVATLLRDCGYGGHAIYGSKGTAMTLTNAISALRNKFQYTAHMKQYSSGAKIFTNIIKSEMTAKRPVMIQATHNTNGYTHSFVIDGYDPSDETFHLNMGWSGLQNTWYSVAGGNSYNYYVIARRMLYEIIPNRTRQAVVDYEDEVVEEVSTMEKVSNINIQVYTDHISINTRDKIKQWNIYNIYGQSISSGTTHYITITSLPIGTYSIVVTTDSDINQTKFIQQ